MEDAETKGRPNFVKYKDVYDEAILRFKEADDAENENRTAAQDDIQWRLGNQWAEKTKKARKQRPTLTVNRLDEFVRRTVNELRKNRPAIKVGAADSAASDHVASIMGGMIRAIERTSHADIAYDTAIDQAVGSGFGHFRICTDYADDDSFLQEIRIERIANQFSVYSDPKSLYPDYFDGKWRFVTEMFKPEAFEEEYGFKPSPLKDVAGAGENHESWWDGDMVRVAEYWRVVEKPVTLHLMPDGQVVQSTDTEAQDDEKFAASNVFPTKSRKGSKRVVECYMMTGEGCFKKSDYKGKYIPIVTIIGEEITDGEKRILKSLIRDAKDPQKMVNYWKSLETELLAAQNKSPVWLPKGSIDDPEIRKKWDSANWESWPYLEYEVTGGQAPQRQNPPTFPTAAREGANGAVEDMKAVMGIHDASLGAPGREQAGVAIFERKLQGDVSTYHFVDNYARALRAAGTIIVDLIPHVYDTARIVRWLGEDGKTEQKVQVNQAEVDKQTGQIVERMLNAGKYDVSVSAGPSFTTQREEAGRYQMALMTANPQMGQSIGDIIVKNQEWPDADEMAKRIRKTIPPYITGDAPHPTVQAQIDQGKQQAQQLQQQLGQLQQQMQGMGEENAALKDFIRSANFEVEKEKARAAAVQAKATGDQSINYVKAVSDRIRALASMITAQADASATATNTKLDIAALVNEMNSVADSIEEGPMDESDGPEESQEPDRAPGNGLAYHQSPRGAQ